MTEAEKRLVDTTRASKNPEAGKSTQLKREKNGYCIAIVLSADTWEVSRLA